MLLKEATTLNVLVSGVVPALAAVNAGMLPVPLFTARPIASFVRDQEKVAPGVLLAKTIDGTAAPVQTVWLATVLTFGTGFTVMVNTIGAPVHTAPVVGDVSGVTVMVAVIGAFVAFTALNDAILPEPEAARPIDGLLLVQLKIVPGTGPLKFTVAVAEPLQTVWLATAFTEGMSTTFNTTWAKGRQAGSSGF